jgi:hypothetical protein
VEAVAAPTLTPNISIAPTFIQNGPTPPEGSHSGSTTADWWMVGLTAVMAFLTGVLAIVAGRQFRSQIAPSGFMKLPIPDRDIGTLDEHTQLWRSGSRAADSKSLFLFGYIKYQDAISLRRRYFCYRYSADTNRFIRVRHPNYDYED